MRSYRSRLLGCTLLVGCAGASSPESAARPTVEGQTSAVASALPDARAQHAELSARLAKEPLRGMVIAHPRARFFQTVADARAAESALRAVPASSSRAKSSDTVEPSNGPALEVLEDLGDVLKVATFVKTPGFLRLDERFSLELYVRREALLPVLSAPINKEFSDGTGFEVREGAVISLRAAQLKPVQPLLAALPLTLAPSDVALSFTKSAEEKREAASAAPGPLLGCERRIVGDDGKQRMRVAELDALVRALEEEQRAAKGGPERPQLGAGGFRRSGYELSYGCALVGELSDTLGVTNSPLLVDGHAIGKALDAPGDGCDLGQSTAWRIPNSDDAIVSVALARASLRVRTQASALVQSGGCGSGNISFGGKKLTILVAEGRAPVFFADGSPAGTHVGQRTKLPFAKQIGDRWCVGLAYASVSVCFDKANVKEVEER